VRLFVFISHLSTLLKERGKTQKELAEATGLRPARISSLVHQQIFHKIVADTSVAICFALSRWPRMKDRKKIGVRLDTLFSMKEVRRLVRLK
jgi:DNA-binding Xre family transcriptional regulator